MAKSVTTHRAEDDLHSRVSERLTAAGQRYTEGRRHLIQALSKADRPLSVLDILDVVPNMPQSSAYRHLTVLASCGVAHRVSTGDDLGLFELSDEMSGEHHHHVMCGSCDAVSDVASSSKLERALAEAVALAVDETGYQIDAHRIDLVGTCPNCAGSSPA